MDNCLLSYNNKMLLLSFAMSPNTHEKFVRPVNAHDVRETILVKTTCIYRIAVGVGTCLYIRLKVRTKDILVIEDFYTILTESGNSDIPLIFFPSPLIFITRAVSSLLMATKYPLSLKPTSLMALKLVD